MAREAIGRDAELGVVAAFLESVIHGPASLLILGEAGIGKTTVWKEGVAAAVERSYRVLSCRPVEAEASLSYASLGDLVGEVLDEMLPTLPPPQRSALEVALLRAPSGSRDPDQRAVSMAVLGVLGTLSSQSPVVLAIDDVRWLDPPSARVLRFVLRRVEHEPLGLLATLRSTDPDDDPFGLSRAWPEGRVRSMDLGPVSVDTLDRIIRDHLGPGLERSALLQLDRASGGNPFFALEIARALLKHRIDAQPGEPLPIPQSLQDLLRERLAGLGARPTEALRVVALLAQPTVALVEGAVKPSSALTPPLAPAVSAGVVTIEDDRVRFTHPLLASVIHMGITPQRRRQLHRRLAELVGDPEERARHLALATERPDADVAAALDEGASRALSRGAPDAAAELWDMARVLTPPGDMDDVRRRTSQAATAHHAVGDISIAERLWREVIGTSPPGGARAAALNELGQVVAGLRGWEAAITVFDQALAEAESERAIRARAECNLAYCHLFSGNLPEAEIHAEGAVQLVEGLEDASALAESIQAVGFIRFALGRGTQDDFLERALALEPEAELDTLVSPSFTYAQLLKYSDRLDAARSRFHALLERAAQTGDAWSVGSLNYHLAELECWAGNLSAAARHADCAMTAAHQTGMDFYLTMALYARALVDAHLGDVDAARSGAVAGLALAHGLGIAFTEVQNRKVLGFLELSRGDPSQAHHHLGPAVELCASMGVGEPGLFRIIPDEIEALAAMGQLDQAESLLRPFEGRARELDRVWALATGGRCRALLEAARGDLSRAAVSCERALKEHGRLTQPFELGRMLLVRGTVERRAKRRGEARATLKEARAIFDRLGTTLWSRRAEDELARIGGRTPSPGTLTPTERRVAELVAEGQTNREVSAALFMSENTVRSNLKSIFRKLGVRSRTELARRMASERP